MALPETFTQFARTAAEQLRWKKARPLVEDELLTHLCDQRDALMAGGMDETVATAESLRLTGDPYEIGTELDRVHRPKTPKLLFALAALIALAGLAFTALVSFRDYELSYFAVHQSVALLLGTAAMLAAYFLDFTLLGHFALPLALMFHAALILLGLLPIGGFWLRYIYVSKHILLRGLPLLFPLMFAVLLYALRGRRGWGVFAAFVCLAVQCMFCLRVPCLLDLGFLFLCDSALLIFCARNGWFGLGKKLETLLTTLPLAADIVWVLVLGANWFARQLAIVLDPHSYIDGHGYRTVVLRELLQNAKFIGQGGVGPYSAQHLARSEGFGMVDLQAHALTLLVHRCGWLALIALVTLLTALLALAFRRCRRQKSMLARLVSYSVLLSFTTQAAAYLCCDLTLIPISGGVVARQFFCETRTEFLRKNSPFLRTKSETRSLASKATKTYRLLMQSSGEFNTPGGAVNPLLPLLFLPLLHAILGALFLGRQILGNRDDIHFRELLDVTLSVFHENGVDRDHILLNFHLFCPPSSFATLFSRAAFCSARLAISS